jgi:hypothetical protein
MENPLDRLQIESRKKLYLSVTLTSITLFVYSIWEIKWVVVDINDFLGLTSHLTLAYWLGLSLITLCSILVYLDDDLKTDWIFIFILIVIGVFLFGLGVFAEENARFPWSYYPAGEAKMLLSTHHIDTISRYPLISYHCWPASHFISASIILLTGINFDNLIQYMPLFWILCYIFISFAIGRRLNFSLNQSFLLSFLSLTSFWTFHYYYGPQSFAILVYLLLFLFIITFKNTLKERLLLTPTFITLVITHVLTPIAMLSVLFIQSIYKKQTKFLILFLLIFVAWYIYLAPLMFDAGVKEFMTQATALEFFSFLKTEKYSMGTLLTRQIVHNCRLSYLGVYATCMAIAFILYLTGRVKKENKERLNICFLWLIGAVLLLVLRYGATEIDDRVFVLSLLPMACIMILSFNRKLFILLMVLLIVLHIPAHYGAECYQMARTTELKGAEFFAMKISSHDEPYSYRFHPYVRYYDPEKVLMPWKSFTGAFQPDISTIGPATYIANSNESQDFMLYSLGFDPVQTWIEQNKNNLTSFYDNGYFKWYMNTKEGRR